MSNPTGRAEGYEIRVRGHLAPRWATSFEGMILTPQDDGTTVILDPVADQSALHGLFRTLSDLGLPLVSVKTTAENPPANAASNRANNPSAGPIPKKEHDMTTVSHTAPPATAAEPAALRGRMNPMRKVALAGGLLYLLTFAASIPQLKLFANIVDNPEGFITGHGSKTPVLLGSWLEVITALAGIGTAIALYPVTRRVSKSAAIGFVTSRVTEAALILVGVVSLLTVVTMRADLAGATGARADALRVTGHALLEMRQWTFLLGPGVMAGINGLFLGYVMYRSRLVPRIIPTIGLIGAPLILASSTATMFGLWDQLSRPAAALALPVAAWEFSLGVWLTVKGFKPEALKSLGVSATTDLTDTAAQQRKA
jgi:uncharacterized protein DUF4386